MKKIVLVALIIAGVFIHASAQKSGDPPVKRSLSERLVFGGSLGAQFGTNTQVNLSPIIGYRATEKLTTGIGVTYIYYKYKYYTVTNQTLTEEDNIWGGSLWAEYRVIPQAFLHVEPGFLNLSVPKLDANNYYYGETTRDNIYQFLVGGGYYQAIGNNAGMQFSILWDLVDEKYSPYENPIIRIGFAAGF